MACTEIAYKNEITSGVNIWQITDNYPFSCLGGVEEVLRTLGAYWPKDTNVSYFHRNRVSAPEYPSNGSIHQVKKNSKPFPLSFPLEVLAMRRFLKEQHPDCVIINMTSVLGIATAWALGGQDTRAVLWWHCHPDYDRLRVDPIAQVSPLRGLAVGTLKKCLVNSMQIAPRAQHAAVSKYIADLVDRVKPPYSAQTPVFNPPTSLVPSSEFSEPVPSSIGEKDLMVFLPVRIAPGKQLQRVRQIAEGLQARVGEVLYGTNCERVNFVFAGASSSRDYLDRALPHPAHPQLAVTYLGAQSHRQLRALYSRAHCIFLPNAAEPFGLVTVEALRFGKPIMGYKSGGTGEILKEIPGYPCLALLPKSQMEIEDLGEVASFLRMTTRRGEIAEQVVGFKDFIDERYDPSRLSSQLINFVLGK